MIALFMTQVAVTGNNNEYNMFNECNYEVKVPESTKHICISCNKNNKHTYLGYMCSIINPQNSNNQVNINPKSSYNQININHKNKYNNKYISHLKNRCMEIIDKFFKPQVKGEIYEGPKMDVCKTTPSYVLTTGWEGHRAYVKSISGWSV